MRPGDIVKIKPRNLDLLKQNWSGYPGIPEYFGKRHKIVSITGGLANFSTPKRLHRSRLGTGWSFLVENLDLVRKAKPQKCKWANCGKFHDEETAAPTVN